MSANPVKPEIQGSSIVVLGSFNPAIFQPRWFSSQGLIRDEEAVQAEEGMQIIHREVSVFSAEWFSLQVTDERFVLETADPTKNQALRDLAVGTFKILEHTPITAFGMNTNRHFKMSSSADWHAFGDHFAPKASWHPILEDPGMRSLTMWGKRQNCSADRVQIKVEPSAKFPDGVFIQVNEHYQLETEDKRSQTERMAVFLTALRESWDSFQLNCDLVTQHLFAAVQK